MRHLAQIVPQHIPEPLHSELALLGAYTPYGTSLAAAIVACVLYFVFFCCATANFFVTKYPFYDVLMISTAFRTAAFAVRAVYTVRYKPALVGTWLAFNNAGFGANIATLCLALGTWVNKVGFLYYGKWEQRLYAFWAYILVLSVVIFGPICGVIAAGMEYGGYRERVSYYGERLRYAATYGLVSVVVGMLMLAARHMVAAFITHRSKSEHAPPTEEQPGRQPKLVAMFFICGMLLAVRGATGCVAIYLPEKYMKIWVEDKYFYPLDTLPEYIVLIILCWPAFMARMAQSWPNSLLIQKHGKKGAKKAKEEKKEQAENGHAADANGQSVDVEQA